MGLATSGYLALDTPVIAEALMHVVPSDPMISWDKNIFLKSCFWKHYILVNNFSFILYVLQMNL